MTDPYETDAAYYDMVNSGHDHVDIGLWLSFAGRTDRPVLEVGTGTGRIALALARAGHEVMAIDPSPSMLAVARRNAEDDAIDGVSFIEGRTLDLVLEQDFFGVALLGADVFLYCTDGDEQVETLRALGRTLVYNGRLIIDLPGPAAWLDPSRNGEPALVFSGELSDGELLDVWQVREDDLAEQRRVLRVSYDRVGADGIVRRRSSEHTLRYLYRFEIEYLLSLAGLAQVDLYGDYDLGPLTNESERMIVVARRRDA